MERKSLMPDHPVRKAIQAKHVDGYILLVNIYFLIDGGNRPATIWDLERLYPNTPKKVLRAKLRKLIRQDYITGCVCGCRGDFQLKEPFYFSILGNSNARGKNTAYSEKETT